MKARMAKNFILFTDCVGWLFRDGARGLFWNTLIDQFENISVGFVLPLPVGHAGWREDERGDRDNWTIIEGSARGIVAIRKRKR